MLRAQRHAHTLQASDLASTSRVVIAIVTIAKNAKDWNLMDEQVLLLSKKHGQLKQATTKMVQTVMGFLDETPNLETKLSVIETLRTVTEGKVGSTVIPPFWSSC
jgi:26S proteasome regulatory subunit N5